jgi:hypothetical protein
MSRLTVILHLLVPHSSVKKMATCTGDKASCYLKPSSRRWGATDITERNTRFACVSYTMTPPMLRVAMTSEDQPYVVHRNGGEESSPLPIAYTRTSSDSGFGELALGPLAFVGSLTPRTPAQPYQQKQELAQDQDPRPERVHPAIAHRVLKRDCSFGENKGCETAEEAVCGDGCR